MRTHMVRESRLLGFTDQRSSQQEPHIHTDWELSEEDVWEMGSLHGSLPALQTNYSGTAALSKAQQRAMETSRRSYSNLLPKSRSSLSLIAGQRYGAASAAMDVPAQESGAGDVVAIEAAGGGGGRAVARSLNITGVRKKINAGGSYGDEDEDHEAGMTPPHVIASRQRTAMACSVMEGAGRTLKGRDLRNVRNAVWKHTGFYG